MLTICLAHEALPELTCMTIIKRSMMISSMDSLTVRNFQSVCPHRDQGKQGPSGIPVDCVISAYFEAKLT